jgi:glucosamine-6-phosphate deaminase
LRIRIFPTPDSAARALAADVAAAIRSNPALVVALPTGRTPVALYRYLTELHQDGAIDFSRVTTFNLDEFEGIGPSDPRSYRTFLQRHLFGRINLSPRRVHCLNGGAGDPDAECERYERAIARAGGIDLLLLGLGRNGHVGFNEPGDFLVARTHRAKLAAATRHANRALFGSRTADVPRAALSIGIGTILEARRIVLMATGTAKARPVERMVNGPVTPRLPASFLQLHRAVDLWLDRAAAGRLGRPR